MPSFTDTLKVNGQDMAMYASLPSGPGPHPAVVIAFHIGGVDEFDKAMADRLAEAFAECLHERVRKVHWGYAMGEKISEEDLIKERFRGIRPAPGYPACPDHTEKRTLFALLDAEKNTGITLTESFAMTPTASVSGWYLSHPDAAYFGVGRIGRDQVEDYAGRKGWSIAEAELWLSPNLGYDPEGDTP